MKDQHATLRTAIKQLHGCDSRHSQAVPVRETFQGQVAWDGVVEVFDLIDHPSARQCYAWAHQQDDGAERFVAILREPPIDSPELAVRAAIIAEVMGRTT